MGHKANTKLLENIYQFESTYAHDSDVLGDLIAQLADAPKSGYFTVPELTKLIIKSYKEN